MNHVTVSIAKIVQKIAVVVASAINGYVVNVVQHARNVEKQFAANVKMYVANVKTPIVHRA